MVRKAGKYCLRHNNWIQSKTRKRSKRWRYQRFTRNRHRKMHKAGKIPKSLKRHKAMMRYKSKKKPTVNWRFVSRRCHWLEMDLCASGGVKKWIKNHNKPTFQKGPIHKSPKSRKRSRSEEMARQTKTSKWFKIDR